MKKKIHPAYIPVVFEDINNNERFLIRSSIQPTEETIQWEDGNTYPLIKVQISATSHNFYTGKQMLVDTEGRIDRFKKRYKKK